MEYRNERNSPNSEITSIKVQERNKAKWGQNCRSDPLHSLSNLLLFMFFIVLMHVFSKKISK